MGKRNGPGPKSEATSTKNTTAGHHSEAASDYTAGADRFRRAWSRQFFYECGCSMPCRCDYHENPTPQRVDGYRDAVEHLESWGLVPAALMPECRKMWTRGRADRELSSRTVRRWTA